MWDLALKFMRRQKCIIALQKLSGYIIAFEQAWHLYEHINPACLAGDD